VVQYQNEPLDDIKERHLVVLTQFMSCFSFEKPPITKQSAGPPQKYRKTK
jgi:hypothetical protein